MIYLAQADRGGPIRIGTSKNVLRRMVALSCVEQCKVRPVAIGEGGFSEEKFLHHAFSPLHVRGEWFAHHPSFDVLRSDLQAGALQWMPDFALHCSDWVRDRAGAIFGSLDAAKVALGYSEKTASSDVFGWYCNLRGAGVRLQFFLAHQNGRLPKYVADLHGANAKFYSRSGVAA